MELSGAESSQSWWAIPGAEALDSERSVCCDSRFQCPLGGIFESFGITFSWRQSWTVKGICIIAESPETKLWQELEWNATSLWECRVSFTTIRLTNWLYTLEDISGGNDATSLLLLTFNVRNIGRRLRHVVDTVFLCTQPFSLFLTSDITW